MPSKAPTARKNLVTRLKARTALADVGVFDGPYVTGDPGDAIHVGYDGDPDGELEAVVVQSNWAGSLGAKKRDEQITIICSVVVTQGESDPDAAQVASDRAYALLAEVEAEILADPSLGLGAPSVAGVSSHTLHLEPTEPAGIQARLMFLVSVNARF